MQLNGDTHHVPLPREGHLCILPEGDTSSATCRRVSQLEVHQLLSSGLQVVYLVGLNGHETPLITSLPESLANGTNLPGGELIYLRVDIPQSMAEGPEWKVLPPGDCLSILMASPIKATPPKVEREVSMTMEVRELLSQVGLDTSGHISENAIPKRTKSCGCTYTSVPQTGRSFLASGTLSQARSQHDTEIMEASLEEILTAPSPQPRHQGPVVAPLLQMQAISERRPTRP